VSWNHELLEEWFGVTPVELPEGVQRVVDLRGRTIGVAGTNGGTYIPRFSSGDRLTASAMNHIISRIEQVERQTALLAARLLIERSKWCHHCGAPWDWARPTCRYCDTVRPPDQ
jgi:hypothetical protein